MCQNAALCGNGLMYYMEDKQLFACDIGNLSRGWGVIIWLKEESE